MAILYVYTPQSYMIRVICAWLCGRVWWTSLLALQCLCFCVNFEVVVIRITCHASGWCWVEGKCHVSKRNLNLESGSWWLLHPHIHDVGRGRAQRSIVCATAVLHAPTPGRYGL